MSTPATDTSPATAHFPDAKRFCGAYTALVTPFKDDAVDYDDLKKLVDFQITNGIDGIVSVGTTGESPTLDTTEHLEVIAKTIEFARGRVPVLAGTGSNSTAEAIALTRHADKAGADGFLIVAPYYNKPNQEGIFQHFSALADATDKPIILYSIPGRCVVDIAVETVVRLRNRHPNIVGIKEAGGSCEKVSRLVRTLDEAFVVLCGDDGLTLPFISLGARGVVSVASNWLPAQVSRLVMLARSGDDTGAVRIHNQLADVFKNLFIEPNPVPVKYVLAQAGLISSPQVRLPLVGPDEHTRAVLDALVAAFSKN
ncbi:MAG: 4-hydroxy-tetrahydrodipicolinate synthase [Puniceicoccales bacterium]|jgi:4-hydroxy-tetrahydrodipicolinate synthase|nr:4-hydroxy-tetrahydrodipicolinate synthase [Puniceicoccales bacterium]